MIRLFLVAALVAAPALAAEPLAVDPGGMDWNELQVLGLDRNGIPVRELRWPDVGEDDSCIYPDVEALLRKQRPSQPADVPFGAGLSLATWELPAPGRLVRPSGDPPLVLYAAAAAGKCSPPAQAERNLAEAKRRWRERGLSWEGKVESLELWREVPKGLEFKGFCFATKSERKGCSLSVDRTFLGRKASLRVTQLAVSDCVESREDEFGHGCQAERRYTGSITLGKVKRPFDFVARRGPTAGQFVLRSVRLHAQNGLVVAVLSCAWPFVSYREDVPLLLRIE